MRDDAAGRGRVRPGGTPGDEPPGNRSGLSVMLEDMLRPSFLVVEHRQALLDAARLGPVLDVACGSGRNGLYLAAHGASVLGVDRSEAFLEQGRALARAVQALTGRRPDVRFVRLDLETPSPPAFARESLGVVLVARYLHRPLVPVLRAALKPGGLLLYETYLEGHQALGKPANPLHLLSRGELAGWFGDWEVLHSFEGRLEDPERIMGRIVCRKPDAIASPGLS